MTTETWLRDYYKLCDAKDVDGIMEHWAPNAVLQFGGGDPIVGATTIRAWFVKFMDSLASQKHKLGRLWELPDGHLVFEAEVENIRLDGHEVTVQGATICRVENGRFIENRTYVDISPAGAPVTGATTSAVSA